MTFSAACGMMQVPSRMRPHVPVHFGSWQEFFLSLGMFLICAALWLLMKKLLPNRSETFRTGIALLAALPVCIAVLWLWFTVEGGFST